MKTHELLERIELRNLGQRDLRLAASGLFSHEIAKMAGTLEWMVFGSGSEREALAAQVVLDVEPKIKKRAMAIVKELRALSKEIERVDPSVSSFDIGPRGLARSEAEQQKVFGWWKATELQQALTDAYLKVHSLKFDFDQMEEVPSFLKRSYDTMLKASAAVSSAQDVAQKLYNEMRHAQKATQR
jgi:hypothetical protein